MPNVTDPLDPKARLRLLGGEHLGDAVERLAAVVDPRRAVAGWGTVELDRAERELAAAIGSLGPHATAEAPDDVLLGARVRRLRALDRPDELLLEPATEGLLAAALARHGEGRLVLYLEVGRPALDRARLAGFTLSEAADGPLGPECRVVVGPRDGPFVLLVTP